MFIETHKIFSHGLKTLRHAGSSSLIRDQAWAPCVGGMESQPLEHKGNPCLFSFESSLVCKS